MHFLCLGDLIFFVWVFFVFFFFFFQAEDGIRDWSVTGVQTCALPISCKALTAGAPNRQRGLNSARLLGLAIIHNPQLLVEIKFLIVMAVKIGLVLVLSVGGMERSRQWFKALKA